MLCDYHIHTNYSDDSEYLMEDVVKDAIDLKLQEICFTDHVDYGVKTDWKNDYDFPKNTERKNVNYHLYFQEIAKLQNKYKGQIKIKSGLEFGMQTHTIAEFQKLYLAYPIDFILLSIHQVNNQEFWNNDFQKNRPPALCYDEYYKEMYSLVKNYKHYSCLAHLDLIRRYLDKKENTFNYAKEYIEKILLQVIKDNKGIEVNTSSHRYGIDDLTPSIDILKLYKKLGGKIITIGSDSHQKEDLGTYINETKKVLKDLGFCEYCTYEKMQPIFHKL